MDTGERLAELGYRAVADGGQRGTVLLPPGGDGHVVKLFGYRERRGDFPASRVLVTAARPG